MNIDSIELEFEEVCPNCGGSVGNINPEYATITYSCCGLSEDLIEVSDD